MANLDRNPARRRGTVVVFTAVSFTVLIGFAALAIDVGYAYSVQAQLQRNADAAALAGAIVLTSDKMLTPSYDPTSDVISEVDSYAALNISGGVAPVIAGSDIIVGFINDLRDPTETINPSATPFNAVQVMVRLEDNNNGELPLFFASIFGFSSVPLRAVAMAGVEDGFSAYRPPSSGTSPLLPFSISIDKFNDQITEGNGPDQWSWNETTRVPNQAPDGKHEIWIFPTGTDAAGNFGILNIGVGNQGTAQLGSQIQNGITDQELISEIGTGNLLFVDSDGNPQSYTMTGNPGISGGMSSYVQARVGDVVAYFVHDTYTEQGSNATFNIIDLRFGRLFEVDLTGNPADKRIVLQPEAYSGPGIQTDPASTRTGRGNFTLRLTH
ncbi:MAG: hypothetical protein IIA33_01390 [Planctomycetes bacterium]|nr:hypothetical protein [Planctomycetota bacterium]